MRWKALEDLTIPLKPSSTMKPLFNLLPQLLLHLLRLHRRSMQLLRFSQRNR
jgi:hypothetical protein